ncbi:hypothetical protein TNCV_1056621 [Trichonephila clavipes]|nr:hypothetical protein TNCV_1056621 [Trichonephila clavipes]
MITNFFIPELNNHDVQELWFQQDGATCHTARATIDLLKDTFGDRLISRFGPVNWPPRSCDLTPLDYFLWGYVKPGIENVDKIREIIEVAGHDSSRSIAQELKIDHKTALTHLSKVGLKKDSMFGYHTTALAKGNEKNPILKMMVIGDEKGVTHDKIVRKRLYQSFINVNAWISQSGCLSMHSILNEM